MNFEEYERRLIKQLKKERYFLIKAFRLTTDEEYRKELKDEIDRVTGRLNYVQLTQAL